MAAHAKISFGASVRSGTTISLDGHADVRLPGIIPDTRRSASADFSFPLRAVFGVSYRPTPQWNLEFDAEYDDWSSVGTFTIKQSAAVPPVLPQNVRKPLNWQPGWFYVFGATYYLENGWHVSGGYIFAENSLPNAFYTPLVADSQRRFFSLGVGRKVKSIDFDIAYQVGYGPRMRSAAAQSRLRDKAQMEITISCLTQFR